MKQHEIILEVFRTLPDPRVERTKVHRLEIIMFIALCTYLTGGQGFYDMESFAESKEDWLRKTVGMLSVPSHDTFNRVFQAILPEKFNACLLELSNRLREIISGDVVAFDGKTHRRTGGEGKTALHMLNAWSVGNSLVLGQLAIGEKTNEITAVPQLMDILDLKGCVVTADALNCQKTIAAKTLEKGAEYILAVKGNQHALHEAVTLFMDAIAAKQSPGFESVEKDHGRIEERRYWQSDDIAWYSGGSQWPGLRSFVVVESMRESKGQQEHCRRYYISSLAYDVERVAKSIRDHWRVEYSDIRNIPIFVS